MDNTPNTQPYPSEALVQTNAQPPRKNTEKAIIILLICIVLILVSGIGFLFFTATGLGIVNSYFPSSTRTLNLAEREIARTPSYSVRETVNKNGSGFSVDGVEEFPASYNVTITYPVPYLPLKMSSWSSQVVSIDGSSWGRDPYDGTYHVAADGVEKDFPLTEIFDVSVQKVLGFFVSDASSLSLAKDTSGRLFLSIAKGVQTSAFGGGMVQSAQLGFDPQTDQPSFFALSLLEGTSTQVSITGTLLNQSQAPTIQAPSNINPFGDFVSRESTFLNTGNEEHDYLWNRWEQKYFSCTQCVNENGDNDGDGLDNQMEFLFGANPLEATSGPLTANDSEALEEGMNPVSGQPLSPAYAVLASPFIQDSEFPPPGKAPVQSVLGFSPRISGAQFPLVFLKTAQDLKLQYTATLPATDYITFFINNTLLQKIVLTGSTTQQEVDIPTSQFAGTTTSFTVIMNPYGPLDSTVPTGNFSFIMKNVIIKSTTPKTPFYVE